MSNPLTWTVEIVFSEDQDKTRADAVLNGSSDGLQGWGRARRTPPTPTYHQSGRRSPRLVRSVISPTICSTRRPTASSPGRGARSISHRDPVRPDGFVGSSCQSTAKPETSATNRRPLSATIVSSIQRVRSSDTNGVLIGRPADERMKAAVDDHAPRRLAARPKRSTSNDARPLYEPISVWGGAHGDACAVDRLVDHVVDRHCDG